MAVHQVYHMPSTPPIDVNDGKWPAWHYAQYMTLRDFPTWQYIYVLVIVITMVMRFWQYINGRG